MAGKIFKNKFSTGNFTVRIEDIDGLCSYPEDSDPKVKEFLDSHSEDGRSISISTRLKAKRKLEILIHESLHAEYPSIAKNTEEDWVEEAAENIASLLWKIGYRENKG